MKNRLWWAAGLATIVAIVALALAGVVRANALQSSSPSVIPAVGVLHASGTYGELRRTDEEQPGV